MAHVGINGPVPRISPEAFMGVYWTGVSVTGVLLLVRGYARFSTFGKLLLDDYFVLLAWLMFLISACIWKFLIVMGWNIEMFGAGVMPPGYVFNFQDLAHWARWSLAATILYYQILYSIKASFLVVFWRLGDRVKGYKIHWWIVTVVITLSWLIGFILKPYYCFVNLTFEKIGWCLSPEQSQQDYNLLYIGLAINLVTDLMIVSLPLSILWRVKINLKQKLALMGIFLLTFVTMIFDAIRVTVVSVHNVQIDQLWMHVWGAGASAVAIIVACLVSFRVFFTKPERNTSRRSHRRLLGTGTIGSIFSKTKSKFLSTPRNLSKGHNDGCELSMEPSRTTEFGSDTRKGSSEMPVLDGILVSKSFHATLEPSKVHVREITLERSH